MSSHLHLTGAHAKKLMGKYKHGAKVKLSVHGRISSMESRDSLGDMISSDSKKKKSATEHHVSIDVENAADESNSKDESE